MIMSRQEHVHCARPGFDATEAVQTDSGYTCKIDMNKSVRGRFGLGLLIDWVMLTPKTCNKTLIVVKTQRNSTQLKATPI